MKALRLLVNVATGVAALLAFAWPVVVGADPSDPRFRAIAVGTLAVLFAALGACLMTRARR